MIIPTDDRYLFEGLLEVPEGKSVMDLPPSHFRELCRRKGQPAIIRGLTNLQNWFKYRKPSLSKWAIEMKKKVRGQ